MANLDNMLSRLWVDFITENDKMHLEEKDNLDVFDSYVKNIYANEEYDLDYLIHFVIDNYILDIKKPVITEYNTNDLMLLLQKLSKNIKCQTKIDIINTSAFDTNIKIFLYYFTLIYEEEFLNISSNLIINQLSLLFSINSTELNKEEVNELIIKQLSKIGIKDYSNIIVKFILRNKRRIFENNKAVIPMNDIEEEKPDIEIKEKNLNTQQILLENEVISDIDDETIKDITEEKTDLFMTIKLKDKFNRVNLYNGYKINISETSLIQNVKNKVKEYFKGNYNNRILGVPSTGKSYFLNESLLKNTKLSINNISKISIEKGINGTTSNRLILGYGYKSGIPIDKEGIVLKIIKKAIQNPNETYLLILEDVHNQNMNDLLSPLISIMKNTDRYDLLNILTKYKECNNYEWFKNLNIKYQVDKELEFKNYNDFICFVKEFIYLYNETDRETKLDYPVSVLLPNIINDSIEEEYFLPNNLYINMTSNYNNNSILEMEWEDRINTIILEPISIRSKFKNFIAETEPPKIIEVYMKVNELLENELYKYEYLEAEKLLIGHYALMDDYLKIVSNNDNFLIRKILYYINNSMEYYDIYNKREIIIFIIIELLEIDIFENYINKKLGVNNIFKVLGNVSDIHSLEDNDKIKLSKSIKKLLK